MKFYRKIEVDNYDTIVTKVKKYFDNVGLTNSNYTGFIPIKPVDLIIACPELHSSLMTLGFSIVSFGLYRTTNNSQAPVHIDYAPYECRINIPILNCEHSSTVYYNADIVSTKNQNQDNFEHVRYIQCTNEVEIDRVTIDQPTVLRINKPHQVIMNEQRSPRLCLTIRCEPDPVILLTT